MRLKVRLKKTIPALLLLTAAVLTSGCASNFGLENLNLASEREASGAEEGDIENAAAAQSAVQSQDDGGESSEAASGAEENNANAAADTKNSADASSAANTASASGTEAQLTAEQLAEQEAEQKIYTFFQGPKAWEAQLDWSGSWAAIEDLAGGKFGAFGCGLCTMANVYSTLSDRSCSPLDMYDYAQEISDYYPVSGYGAIGWEDMQLTLSTAGVTGTLRNKPETYEAFQADIAQAETAIVLICSDDDDTFWQENSGHYVTVWLYDESDDTVFLGDSGEPENNRTRIPLKLVYDALKTASDWQYLRIDGYSEESNVWQHDGIDIDWCRPDYLA